MASARCTYHFADDGFPLADDGWPRARRCLRRKDHATYREEHLIANFGENEVLHVRRDGRVTGWSTVAIRSLSADPREDRHDRLSGKYYLLDRDTRRRR